MGFSRAGADRGNELTACLAPWAISWAAARSWGGSRLDEARAAAPCSILTRPWRSPTEWLGTDPRLPDPAMLASGGRARFRTFSSGWFCQKQMPKATSRTPTQTNSRMRSSSRWSTMLRRSSWPMGRSFMARAPPDQPEPLGAGLWGRDAGRLGGGSRRFGGRGRGQRRALVLLRGLGVARDRVLELTHSLPQGLAQRR